MPADIGELGLDVSDMKTALNEAKGYLKQFEQAAQDTSAKILRLRDSISESGKSTQAQRRALYLLKQELSFYTNEAKKASTEVKQFEKSIKDQEQAANKSRGTMDVFKGSLSAIVSVLSVRAIFGFAKSLVEFGKDVAETSRITGVLPSNLQKIQTAFSDKLGADETAEALHAINIAMRQAKSGSEEAQDKFDQLGISFKDVQSKSPDKILIQLSDYVANASDKTEALRRVSALFGDDMASKLIPVLSKGSKELQNLADAASAPSDAMIESAEKAARAWDDAGRRIKNTILGLYASTQNMKPVGLPEETEERRAQRIHNEAIAKERGVEVPSEVAASEASVIKKREGGISAIEAGKKAISDASSKEQESISPSQSKIDLLNEQSIIGYAITSDAERQLMLAQAQLEYSKKELEIKGKHEGIEKAQLEANVAIVDQKERAAKYAVEMQKVQSDLAVIEAGQGRVYEEKVRVDLAQLAEMKKREDIVKRTKGANDPEIAAIAKRRRDKMLEMIEDRDQHNDAIMAIRMQNAEIEAGKKGLLGLIETLKVEAQSRQQILDALRNGNKEAAALLQHQKDMATVSAKAAAYDVTAKDRRMARRKTAVEESKAEKLDKQDSEQLRRYDRMRSSAGSYRITPRMAEAIARRDMAKQSKNEQGNSIETTVNRIAEGVDKIASNTIGIGENFSK